MRLGHDYMHTRTVTYWYKGIYPTCFLAKWSNDGVKTDAEALNVGAKISVELIENEVSWKISLHTEVFLL